MSLNQSSVAAVLLFAGSLVASCAPSPEHIAEIYPDGLQVVDVNADAAPPANAREYADRLGYVYQGAELIQLLSGRTAYGSMNERDGEWAEYTSHDGRAIFRSRRGELSDGTWWVSGDQACFNYVGSSGAYCNYAVKVENRVQYVLTNGRLDYYVQSFGAGDSENLTEALLLRN